jgi:hypothetical protein
MKSRGESRPPTSKPRSSARRSADGPSPARERGTTRLRSSGEFHSSFNLVGWSFPVRGVGRELATPYCASLGLRRSLPPAQDRRSCFFSGAKSGRNSTADQPAAKHRPSERRWPQPGAGKVGRATTGTPESPDSVVLPNLSRPKLAPTARRPLLRFAWGSDGLGLRHRTGGLVFSVARSPRKFDRRPARRGKREQLAAGTPVNS